MIELAKGAGATLLLSASAEQLLTSADGSIEGVLASVDGERRALRARQGVVLATGGFALNREMVANHAPECLGCAPFDLAVNDGWGIRAGQQAGGEAIRMGAAALFWALYPPVSRKAGVLVNRQGQRFIAEDSYYGTTGNVIVNEQRGVAHLIVDAQALGEKPDRGRTTPDQPASEIAAQADSIEELERALEIPAPALQNTIAVYNDYANKREDPLFRKAAAYLRPLEKPPFSAVKASVGEGLFAFFTLGGLHVSPRSEVLDKQGDPIPKLYAAGRAAAGIPSLHSASYLSGLSLSECLTFGRIAGANAAKG
jgi:3-oxo-5alpha-steroid 4-dehydrogenase